MDSMPPATTIELFPVSTAWAASATAFNPDPQTLLTVMAPTLGGRPPKMAACRAGFWPSPADTTLPMMHSSTCSGSSRARATASRTTTAPSWVALKSERLPWNFPTGVRQPEMMTTASKAAIHVLLCRLLYFSNYSCAAAPRVENLSPGVRGDVPRSTRQLSPPPRTARQKSVCFFAHHGCAARFCASNFFGNSLG